MKNRNEDNAEFTISQHFHKVFLNYFLAIECIQQCPNYTTWTLL